MKFSYNLLQDLVSKKLPAPNKVAELLTMHAFEVESVEKVEKDHILDIDILPNRAHDASGHVGVARDLAVLVGSQLKQPTQAPVQGAQKVQGLRVHIEDSVGCTRYMAARMDGVSVKSSPAWLQQRLEAMGLKSINNIVDATNYAMLVTGQPLHAFDYDKLAGNTEKTIIVRKAKKGERLETLDEKTYTLGPEMLVIADSNGPVAIAGIKGGKSSGVDKGTTRIVIEAARFDPQTIRRASQALNLKTDASWRFERDVPALFAQEGLQAVIALIEDVAGGKKPNEAVDAGGYKPSHRRIPLRLSYTRELLGTEVKKEDIERILKALEFGVEPTQDGFLVSPPLFRLDVEREEDIIEEVGRIIGYEKIPASMPNAALYPPVRNATRFWTRQIKAQLASFGFYETYNLSFVGPEVATVWQFSHDILWELENPISEELPYLRPSLVPNLATAAHANLRFADTVRLFEIGEAFFKGAQHNEEERLCIAVATKSTSADALYEATGALTSLFESVGLSDTWIDNSLSEKEKTHSPFLHPTREAQVKIGSTLVGVVGQLHPNVARALNMKGTVVVGELRLAPIIENTEKEHIYAPISPYPESVRDISIIIPVEVKAGDVERVINEATGEELRDVDLFDYYEADNTDMKSIAFHLIFQANDRTLTTEEVDAMMASIVLAIENSGWSVK